MEFEGFAQVGEGFFFGLALAGDVDFEALGDVPVSFTPNGRGEGALHRFRITEAGRFGGALERGTQQKGRKDTGVCLRPELRVLRSL